MATWSYEARAYRIDDFAKLQQQLNDHFGKADETIEEYTESIKLVLAMAEVDYISAKKTPKEYRTICQCKRWLKDFARRKEG